MGVLATATVDIIPNLKPLNRGLAEARVSLERFARTGGGFALTGGAAAIGTGIAAAMVSAAKKAASFAEVMNKVKVTFGTSSSGFIKQADDLADRFGLVKRTTLEAAANFGLFGRAAGMSTDESAAFAKQLVQLGVDLSSFHNISREAAFEKLESGLAGQVRPLRALGIFLSEDAVKARALALGLGEVGRELSDQEKIRARFSLIMEQAGPAHGDLARTAESTHNQMLKFQGDLENAITALGHEFEPALLESIKLARELGKTLSGEFAGAGITIAKVGEEVKTTVESWTAALKLFQVLRKSGTADLISKHGILGGITEAVFQLDKTPGGGKGLPATLPDVLAKQREAQMAGTMADIAASQQRAMPPSLRALAEAELGPDETAAEKRAEKRERALSAHMRRIQAEQDRALSESLSGVARGPQGAAAIQRDMANRLIDRFSGPSLLNTIRNLQGGPINALMGGGYGGMALATGLQAAQAELEKAGPSAFREKPKQPSMMFADPSDFAREAITGVLSEDPDKKELLETQKQAAKDLEQIKEDVREGLRNIGKGFRGLFPRG